MAPNRPRGRDKNVTSGGSGVHRRGSGLGTGPVGTGQSGRGSGGGGGKRAAAGGSGLLTIIVILVLLFMNRGGGAGDNGYEDTHNNTSQSSSVEHYASSSEKINYSVAAGTRPKRTEILGKGKDTVTIMVYMCGTDLESKSGMASNDIQEMANARFGDNVNLLLYTGGCKQWKTSGISNTKNQIYQVVNGKLKCLEKDMGSKSMTDPATLTAFIKYCTNNYPANRNELIFWDHGGGSVTGFGYDEVYSGSGSMNLAGISKALRDSNTTFDFVGFDACLMATAETALMMNNYADYLIASEETEPGIGWYYTDWLTKLGKDTSMSTLEIGKNIADDFTSACARHCSGQKTTLSVIDVAEFANTIPGNLSAFADSVSNLMSNQEYQTVSNARYGTREFAQSSKIDQVDLVHLALNMDTTESKALAKALKEAVKYNRTSSNMTDAYGVSIFFPYKRTSYVDKACKTYDQIDMDDSYAQCIRQFASLETSGQVAAGGSSNASPISSLFGGLTGGSSGSADMIGQLLSGFMGAALSGGRGIDGLDASNTDFMKDNPLSQDETAEYLALNYLDASNLVWQEQNGKYIMRLTEDQWDIVHQLDKNMFYDDGEGYVDLGLDNVFDFDSEGNLIADMDKDWLAVNGQVVAYYHTDTTESGDDYTISGYIPAYLNGDRVKLLVNFDNNNPDGYIVGADTDYRNNETETIAKSLVTINQGDKLDFVCDYYRYDGSYQDSYYLGEQMTVGDTLTISNVPVGDGHIKIAYRFTDMYNQAYWSESITE